MKSKKISGDDYVEKNEIYKKKMKKKTAKGMKTAGLALKLKQSESQQGYSKMPRVKPQKKSK
jgi:hypothetical protein